MFFNKPRTANFDYKVWNAALIPLISMTASQQVHKAPRALPPMSVGSVGQWIYQVICHFQIPTRPITWCVGVLDYASCILAFITTVLYCSWIADSVQLVVGKLYSIKNLDKQQTREIRTIFKWRRAMYIWKRPLSFVYKPSHKTICDLRLLTDNRLKICKRLGHNATFVLEILNEWLTQSGFPHHRFKKTTQSSIKADTNSTSLIIMPLKRSQAVHKTCQEVSCICRMNESPQAALGLPFLFYTRQPHFIILLSRPGAGPLPTWTIQNKQRRHLTTMNSCISSWLEFRMMNLDLGPAEWS